MSRLIQIAESGYVPDPLLRLGIKRLLRQRLRNERCATRIDPTGSPNGSETIALATDRANEQHYELPPEFFELMLGARLKYSSCYWPERVQDLDGAEEAMLELSCERAGIRNGMRVLDLGSGWGSLGLWIAERYPGCRVTTVSNSEPQQRFIRRCAEERGLGNVETIRADVNGFRPEGCWNRVVSVEMFEHVRDHAELLARIAGWLAPGGKLFVHVFCHRTTSYPFEIDGDNDWMARHFFTGGMMPSLDMLNRIDRDMRVIQRWEIDGTHYERTLSAWLERLDDRRGEAMRILADHHGPGRARVCFVRWRLFLLACAELFGFRQGREWLVGHYLLEPARSS